ncbi:hypothetical protein JCGZ_03238 [Jatropha curcas]|uniref:Uncharacterized protein n=1 Tax=Jatropha curcas TaxID=180498 RepID=A0A067L1K6_JATCU|nr:hypothetical protein JCGZ_03238 [Jatropha curcas]
MGKPTVASRGRGTCHRPSQVRGPANQSACRFRRLSDEARGTTRRHRFMLLVLLTDAWQRVTPFPATTRAAVCSVRLAPVLCLHLAYFSDWFSLF